MDFVIDTVGDQDLQVKTELLDEKESKYLIGENLQSDGFITLFEKKKTEIDDQLRSEEDVQRRLSQSKSDELFDNFFDEMRWTENMVRKKEKRRQLFQFDQLDKDTGKLNSTLGVVNVEKEMEKCVLHPAIEKEHALPRYDVSERKLKELRKKEREKTKGPEWFNMPAPEITEELKNDLKVLKMRSAMDPKHFYKKNDMEVLPKYFQVGRIMDSPLDHVNERLTRKQRKRTMVEELLADAEFQKYSKKKYKEIIDEKRKSEYRTFMKDKRQINKRELKKNKINAKKNKTN